MFRSLLMTASLLIASGVTPAQDKARGFLDAVIESLGGQAFLSVREILSRGEFSVFKDSRLVGRDAFVDYVKFPAQERTEFGKGGGVITINNENQGWTIENKKITPQTPEQVTEFQRAFKTTLDYVLRFVLNDPKTTIELSSGTSATNWDIVEIQESSGTRISFYIDRRTLLPIKAEVRPSDSTQIREETYVNYRKIQGVMTPLLVTRYTDGVKTMEISGESVSFNSGLNESLSKPPPR